jgi:hypothetical protein
VAENVGEILCTGEVEVSRDLTPSARDRLADHWRGLDVVVENNRQLASDVGTSDLSEYLGAARVELKIDRHALDRASRPHRCVDDGVSSE